MKCLLILFGLVASLALIQATPDRLVCYYGSWASYRPGNGNVAVEEAIADNLCTHVIYAFVGAMWDGTIRILDPQTDQVNQGFTRFANLKVKNPNIKFLMAIGGWNEGSTVYSELTNNAALRSTFVNSIVNFVTQYNLDGFDLDWEYPAQRGGRAADYTSYITLIKELRTRFDQRGWLLTAAVAATKNYHSISYNVPEMSKYLDFINVMAYDLHGAYDGRTGQNAPLYASKAVDTTADSKLLNVDAAISGWIASGASPSKLVLGVGTYGRSFTLSSASNRGLGALTSGAGNKGPYTGEAGFLGYNEVCEYLRSGWTRVWDDEQKNPYAYSGNQWVGYDDVQSITLKTQYAIQKGLGGMMIWSIETDDTKNACGGGRFPIAAAIRNTLKGGSSSVVTTQSPTIKATAATTTTKATAATTTTKATAATTKATAATTKATAATTTTKATTTKATTTKATTTKATTTKATTTARTTTIAPTTKAAATGAVCRATGYIRDPSNCGIFYYCQPISGGYKMQQFKCPSNLVYNIAGNYCDYPSLVKC